MAGPKLLILKVFLLLFLTMESWATIQISGPTVICQGGSASLLAPLGMKSYLWSTGQTTRGITVFAQGTYRVVTVDSTNKIDSGSIDLKQVFNPKPVIGNPLEYLCEGDEAHLVAPGQFASYLWNTGETTSEIIVTKTGTYSLTVVDTNGCTGSSDAVQIIVVPFPKFTISGPTSACRNSVTTYSTTNDTGIVYQWTADGGTIVNGANASSAQISWSRSGNLTVRATRTRPDGGLCVFDTSIFVRVGARLVPDIQYSQSSFCVGGSAVLSVDSSYKNIVWSTGATTPRITVTQPGNYWVTVSDSSGCSGSSDTLPVVAYPQPNVAINGQTVLCFGQTSTLLASSTANDVVFWKWSTGATTNVITVNQPGTYSVVGTTINACVDTAWITVTKAADILVTASNVNFGTVQTGVPVSGIIDVRNNTPFNVSVMGMTSNSVELSFSPPPPRLLPVGSGETFRVTWVSRQPGPLTAVVTIYLLSATCLDTVQCTIEGVATGDPPLGGIAITAPDTTVDVGTDIAFPITISSATQPMSDTLYFDLSFDPSVFRFSSVDAPASTSQTTVGANDEHVSITLPFDGKDSLRSVTVRGTVLLGEPFKTPLILSQPRLFYNPVQFALDDGSITAQGCWLPARIISLNDRQVRMRVFTLLGTAVYDAQHVGLTDSDVAAIIRALPVAHEALFIAITDPSGTLLYEQHLTIAR